MTPKQFAISLLDSIDDDGIPGTVIRHRGDEIWLHTTGQVEEWLRTHLEKAGFIPVSEDDIDAKTSDA